MESQVTDAESLRLAIAENVALAEHDPAWFADAADALIELLLASGYTTSAEFNATLTDRRWFMRHAMGRRTHHLHVVVFDGPQWHERLRFRDALRADARLAATYAALKARLVLEHRTDREAYTEAKAGFVRAVLTGA